MAKAAQVIRAILQEILVQASEQDLDSAETNDTIFAMNNFMFELDANGVKLGYTEVTSVTDTITIPGGAVNGLIKNVAMQIAPQFDRPISMTLVEQARKGLKVMSDLGINLGAMQFPDTLPIGSGNEFDDFNFNHFYPGLDDSILDESNNNILLEGDGT